MTPPVLSVLTFQLQWVIDNSCSHNNPYRQQSCFEFS